MADVYAWRRVGELGVHESVEGEGAVVDGDLVSDETSGERTNIGKVRVVGRWNEADVAKASASQRMLKAGSPLDSLNTCKSSSVILSPNHLDGVPSAKRSPPMPQGEASVAILRCLEGGVQIRKSLDNPKNGLKRKPAANGDCGARVSSAPTMRGVWTTRVPCWCNEVRHSPR